MALAGQEGEPLTGASGVSRILSSRPHLSLRVYAIAVLLCSLAAVSFALRTPLVSVRVGAEPGGRSKFEDGERRRTVSGDRTVSFRPSPGKIGVEVPANLLPDLAEPRGSRLENARYWRDRDRIVEMLAAGVVRIDFGDGAHMIARSSPRELGSIPINFWVPLATGAAALLVSLWVWTLRPGEWAARLFGIGGIGFFAGCVTMALVSGMGLGLGGTDEHLLMILNYASTLLYGGSLTALFARFPLPLIGARWLWLLVVVNAAAAAVVALDAIRGAIDVALIVALLDCVAMVALALAQAWRCRKEPRHRAALVPIAVTTGISVFAFSVLSMGAMLFGNMPVVPPEFSASVLLLMYLGLAVAITRARLFALGRRALSLLLSACVIVLFVVVGILLLASVTKQRDMALLLSCLAAAIIYLPAQEWLNRRAERLRDHHTRDLLQVAGDIALGATPQAASQAWRDAAGAMFDPLEAAAAVYSGAHPEIREGGVTLYLPSPVESAGILLRYPGGGARVFGAGDVATASRFGALVRQLIEARDAYMRGVLEERTRIARDLHDDVNARLLTSLHRTDTEAMHADVRSAIADIRMITTGLSGPPQSLHGLFGTLRHETQVRMAAAGIALDWTLVPKGDVDCPLDYPQHRHILSIVRECVSNVIHHAGASSARVNVAVVGGWLAIDVSDDGRGLDASRVGGSGLGNASRRAAALGGEFAIRSSSGRTVARLRVPIEDRTASATAG
jgi:two-component system sensor histidine kinase DevS